MIFNSILKLLLFGMLAILTAATPLDTGFTTLNLTELIARDLPPADPTGEPCGKCLNDHGNRRYLYASGHCNTLPDGEKYAVCTPPTRCGICMMFKGEQFKYTFGIDGALLMCCRHGRHDSYRFSDGHLGGNPLEAGTEPLLH
jgi:hypothetical protein